MSSPFTKSGPDPLNWPLYNNYPGGQTILNDLFTNLSDDTAIRQERIEQAYAPLKEKLAQAKPGSDEEWALLDELFRWPSLEEWIAPTMTLERLQSMFI